MNGHARQKKFPAQSSTSTNAPRKCTQLNTVARFFGASVGPKSPCAIITTLMASSGIESKVREWRQPRNRPITGTRSRSNGTSWDCRGDCAGAGLDTEVDNGNLI